MPQPSHAATAHRTCSTAQFTRKAKLAFQRFKIVIAREQKADLKRLRLLGIIPSCDWLFSNRRCLLSSANDGEGRCILYG